MRTSPDWMPVEVAAEQVVAAMLEIPESEAKFPRGWWPSSCCEQAAIAIAGTLEDRQLGEWWLVSGHRPGKLEGHSWLECRNENGDTLYSIDVTLHQFPDISEEPFIGPGCSPAAAVFTERVEVCRPFAWRYLGGENGPFLATLRQVRERLGSEESGA